MTTLQYLAAAAGILVVLWPALHLSVSWVFERLVSDDGNHAMAKTAGPTFEQSVSHLAKVRARLNYTSALGDDQKKAIDVLTLALVAGSDK